MRVAMSLLVAALVALVVEIAAAQDPWLGQPVFIKDSAKPQVGTTAIDREKIPFPATVEKINGDWLWLGRAWVKKSDVRRIDEALAHYTEEIRRNPTSPAWGRRGAVWLNKGEVDSAIKDYTEAIRLDPANVLAYNNRGLAWNAKQEYDNAIKDYTESIRLDPVHALTYSNRGESWWIVGDFEAAARDFRQAIGFNAADPYGNYNLGVAEHLGENDARAVLALEQAIESAGTGSYSSFFGPRQIRGQFKPN